MKCLVGLFFPFVLGVVLSSSLNSNVDSKEPPIVHGIGDENLDRKADQMAHKVINGVGEEEGPKAKRTLKADKSVWLKYRQDLGTQWCTVDGRDLIAYDLTLLECQLSCKERGPSCHAVEYWEEYNYACFECTDLSKITEYTNTNDLAYPVYVWFRVISDWSKYKPHLRPQWCTVEGRDIIDYNLSRLECLVRCEGKGPNCTAVEYWEEGNHACFECTDRSMITRYTNTTNPDYPVYVWVR